MLVSNSVGEIRTPDHFASVPMRFCHCMNSVRSDGCGMERKLVVLRWTLLEFGILDDGSQTCT